MLCGRVFLYYYLFIYLFIYCAGVEPSQLLLRPLIVLMYQPWIIDDDDCGEIGGMNDRGNRSTGRKPAQCRFDHHKSYMT
jgi:hypothetical protein